MYLLDTNIFLELLLDQERADEVERFLQTFLDIADLYISYFTLNSIGIILFKRKKHEIFVNFLTDLFLNGKLYLLKLSLEDLIELTKFAKKFNLDFDDAYQYTLAERYDLTLVSFDSDFDRTERGRKTPGALLKEISSCP